MFKLYRIVLKSDNKNVLVKLCKFIKLLTVGSHKLAIRYSRKLNIFAVLCFVLLLYKYVLFIYIGYLLSVYIV